MPITFEDYLAGCLNRAVPAGKRPERGAIRQLFAGWRRNSFAIQPDSAYCALQRISSSVVVLLV